MKVVMMSSLPAADCSTFLPLRRKKLDRQWFGDGSDVGGTTSAEVDDERRHCGPESSATGCRSSANMFSLLQTKECNSEKMPSVLPKQISNVPTSNFKLVQCTNGVN